MNRRSFSFNRRMPPGIFGTLRALAASVDRPEYTSGQRQRGDRVTARRMSLVGHSRRSERRTATSGAPRLTDIRRGRRHVSKVPEPDGAMCRIPDRPNCVSFWMQGRPASPGSRWRLTRLSDAISSVWSAA
jgi:hypothetical protein